MASVTIYTTASCPYCVRAKSLLKGKGIDYTEINLDGKDKELAELQARTKYRTVPQIFIGEEFIGGYVDLAELETQGELDRMLNK